MKYIQLYNKGRIPLPDARADKLAQLLVSPECPKFVEIDGEVIASSAIESVISEQRAREFDRYAAGDYVCKYGKWHRKGERCYCAQYGIPEVDQSTNEIKILAEEKRLELT